MNTMTKTVLAIALALGTQQVLAYECVNNGAVGGVAPDDGGLSSSLACGPGTSATALQSTALGFNSVASGLLSLASGGGEASGQSSVSVGPLSGSFADGGMALGSEARVTGINGSAVGTGSSAEGESSTAVGHNAIASQPNSVVLGSIAGLNQATVNANIGIGTAAPLAPLHIAREDGALLMVEDSALTPAPRTLFMLSSAGNTKFAIDDPESGIAWAFTSDAGQDFRISRQGSGVVEFRVDSNGDAFLAGVLSENSDREAKTGIEQVDKQSILDKVVAMTINEWSYKETPNSRHIGPMAQDFYAAFQTGDSNRRLATLDVGGVAIASVQALNEKLENQNQELTERNVSLEERIALLETMMSKLLPRAAQN